MISPLCCSGLLSVRNVSLNATNAVHAYSTVKSMVENAESLGGDAHGILNTTFHSVSVSRISLQYFAKCLYPSKYSMFHCLKPKFHVRS